MSRAMPRYKPRAVAWVLISEQEEPGEEEFFWLAPFVGWAEFYLGWMGGGAGYLTLALGPLGIARLRRRPAFSGGEPGEGGEEPPPPVINSTLTFELREGTTLRATRLLQPDAAPSDDPDCPATRYQVMLTPAERDSVGTWANVEAWLIPGGGTRAIKVTRFRGNVT